MTNKEASYKQEHMVADFMGWSVVSGSGARPFKPGDITSDYFLVECKTHTERQDKICFRKTHWEKLSVESQSTSKIPILVTDNGTQISEYTWVMLPLRVINNCGVSNCIDGLSDTSRSGNTVIFDHADAMSLYKKGAMDNQTSLFIVKWGYDGECLAIMPLREFKEFYDTEFL